MRYLVKINRATIKENLSMRKPPLGPNNAEDARKYGSCSTPSGPKWVFNYLPCMVICKFCAHTFSYTNLEFRDGYDYTYYDDDEYAYWAKNNICPHCDIEDCCEIEFETLKDGKVCGKTKPNIR